jgi:hypothetical protein
MQKRLRIALRRSQRRRWHPAIIVPAVVAGIGTRRLAAVKVERRALKAERRPVAALKAERRPVAALKAERLAAARLPVERRLVAEQLRKLG